MRTSAWTRVAFLLGIAVVAAWIVNMAAHAPAWRAGAPAGAAPTATASPTADADSDGIPDSTDNCPNWPNATQALPPWSVPLSDWDCDGYSATTLVGTRASEESLGTDTQDKCADTTTSFDERGPAFGEPLSPWPPDTNDDGQTTFGDVLAFAGPYWNTSDGDPDYWARFDLNGDVSVNFGDILSMIPFFNQFCNASPVTKVAYPLFGFDLSPYVEPGQDPRDGDVISEPALDDLIARIAPYVHWIRVYGCGNGLEESGRLGHRYGLKVAMTAWIGTSASSNNEQLSCAIERALAGEIDLLVVGSEVLYRHDLSPSGLVALVSQAQTQVTGIPVGVSDTWFELASNPSVVSAVDVVLPHIHPFWEEIGVDYAIAQLHVDYALFKGVVADKEIWVGETGWPTCGAAQGDAVPNEANAAQYFQNFVSWAEAEGVSYFYFEAFSEPWKAATDEGELGACWGLWTNTGLLKPGMQDVFDGARTTDNWSNPVCPGDPQVAFTYVPPYGNTTELLRGMVQGVAPADYRIAVYINVGTATPAWWTKPTFAAPLTSIGVDCQFATDIVTGPPGSIDHLATQIAAFLVPSGYSPPALGGATSLPQALYDNSLADTVVTRTP